MLGDDSRRDSHYLKKKKIIVAPDSEYSRQVWQNSVPGGHRQSLIPTRVDYGHFPPLKVTQSQFLFFSVGVQLFFFLFFKDSMTEYSVRSMTESRPAGRLALLNAVGAQILLMRQCRSGCPNTVAFDATTDAVGVQIWP